MGLASVLVRPRIGPYPITRGELSGAFADLGVLAPLEAALIAINGLNPTTTLLGIGIIYIAAGLYFGIPMPVQPLKAFSVIAISAQVSPSVIAAGALLIGLIMGGLALLRAVDLIDRLTPLPVVRGIQLGLGLILVRNGFELVALKPFFLSGQQVEVEVAGAQMGLGLVVGLAAVCLLAALTWRPRAPATVVVLTVGVGLGLLLTQHPGASGFGLGPAAPQAPTFGPADFWTAFWLLVVPQLPLSLANSIISTADVARAYFGEQARRVTPRRVAIAYALGNLWAGLAGGLPNCHGAGGLTAHYRLGARTPAASCIIGGTLIAVALLFGQSAMAVRTLVPAAIFGALLLYVGWEHLRLGLQVTTRVHLVIVGLVGATSLLASGNLAVGAVVGLVGYWVGRAATKLGHAAPAR